jgi:protein-disulfide isomerase
MKIRTIGTAALALALAAPGCAQKSDVEAVQATQKEILAKLEKMEKDQGQILAKVNGPAAAAARPAVDPNKVYEIPLASSAVRGSKDAPVTVTMFSDFQCPFCSQAITIVDEVLKAYPQTDVKFVMKQFPLRQIHPNAEPAAEAAVAAGKQGKFWEMHDELYKNGRNLSPDVIKGIAEKIGLDMKKWDADRQSDEVKKQIDAELELGQKVDVRGTPSLFVDGKVVQNRSVEGMKAQIDEELKAKKKG